MGGSYPSAEVQSVYSTAPADWARASLALEKQILLQMLQKSSGCKVQGAKVKSCFQCARFRLGWLILHASNTTAFVDHFFPR